MKKVLSFLVLFLMIFNVKSQKNDTIIIRNESYQFKSRQLYVPASLMVGGIFTSLGKKEIVEKEIVEKKNVHLIGFKNRIDDYAQFTPFVALYAFEWAGMKPRTDWQNRTAIMIKAQIMNLGAVYILKKAIKATRPDGSAYSFPSGHTANAFAGATLLSIEYGRQHRWVPYAAYTLASGIGAMRMVNNKHYISDVLFGAGLGILSVKTAYWMHRYKWGKRKSDPDAFDIIYSRIQ